MKQTITEKILEEQCDPYGSLEFAIGSGEDFVCLDYALDAHTRTACLASTLNSETGSFIMNFRAPVHCAWNDAPFHARQLVDAAIDWCAENGVRMDMKGWNQDPAYFIRAVENAISINPGRVARRVRNWRKHL